MKEQIKKFRENKRKLEQEIGKLLREFELENGIVGLTDDRIEIVRNPAMHTIEDPDGSGFISRVKITTSL